MTRPPQSLLETLVAVSIAADDLLSSRPSHDPRRCGQLAEYARILRGYEAADACAGSVTAALVLVVTLRKWLLSPPPAAAPWRVLAAAALPLMREELCRVQEGDSQ